MDGVMPRRRPIRACVGCDYAPSRYRVNAGAYLCVSCYTRWFVEGVPMEEIQREREPVDDDENEWVVEAIRGDG